jgi:hypothetical protein
VLRAALVVALVAGSRPSVASARAAAPEPTPNETKGTGGAAGLARGFFDVVADVSALTPGEAAQVLLQQIRGTQQTPADSAGGRRASGQEPAAPSAGVVPQEIPAAGPGGPTIELGDLGRATLLESTLRPLTRLPASEVRVSVPGGRARMGDFTVLASERQEGHLLVLRGDANIYGTLQGNVVTVNGDVVVHPGAVVSGDVLAIHGEVRDEGGEIGGEVRTVGGVAPAAVRAAAPPPASVPERILRAVAGVAGVFLTLGALGAALALFGRSNLATVSDTVTHSFGRAFVTGLVGQLLLVPTFGMLVVGLILSVVGVLLLPFAVVIYALLVVVAVVGGFLAVAHAMGEQYTRRRMARGDLVGSPTSYRYLALGLGALLVFWAAWALFGWVPVAGTLVGAAAVLVTWFLGTVGFGAALLSRAGVKEQFAGRLIPPEALTDEYLWATPQFGVPAVKRPPANRTPTRGL